jgi:hypothetical protein
LVARNIMEDFFEHLVNVEEDIERNRGRRLPKRYIRNRNDSFEYFRDREFEMRYRFSKHTVIDIILPLVIGGLQKINNRGLPISPLVQLLISDYVTILCYRKLPSKYVILNYQQ